MEIFAVLDELVTSLLTLLGTWGAVLGCLFILVESILPVLPLSVFITLNFITFGNLLGFIISWLFTVIGCMISYFIFKKLVSEKKLTKFKDTKALGKVINVVQNMNYSSLVTLISIPFAPAFLINIAAGICRVDKKKYLGALLLGKIFLVYFWGYVGVSLIESLKNPIILIRVIVIVVIVYFGSKFLTKKLNVN